MVGLHLRSGDHTYTFQLPIFAAGVECGENRGRTGGAQKNRGRTGGIWEQNQGRTGGFWHSFTKSTGGEAGALGQEPGENRGEGIFFETRDPTRDLKKSTNRTAREN